MDCLPLERGHTRDGRRGPGHLRTPRPQDCRAGAVPDGGSRMMPLPEFHALLALDTWKTSALCSQTDPEVFFPEQGESSRAAKAICRRCAVRAECLESALATDERFGIWGGLAEGERRRLKRAYRIELEHPARDQREGAA